MQKIRIDFDNPGLPQHISAVENDSQSRFFQATLYENGKAYTAPEGATYSIMYRGFGPQNQGWYDTINDGAGKRAACAVSGNVVTCEIARQALQVPGHVSIVLCVTTGKGYMLKSWPIECDCKNDRYDSTAEIQSFFYVTQISNESWTQAIQAVEELKNTIDPTLSVSGKAADAAKVGEAVGAEAERAKGVESQIKEDLSRNLPWITFNTIKDCNYVTSQHNNVLHDTFNVSISAPLNVPDSFSFGVSLWHLYTLYVPNDTWVQYLTDLTTFYTRSFVGGKWQYWDFVYPNATELNRIKNDIESLKSTDVVNVVYCGENEEYTTLRKACEYAISKKNVTLVVRPGTYDLTQEFSDHISAQNGSGIKLTNGIKIIFEAGSYVKAEIATATEYSQHYFEPFYSAGDFEIIGLNISAKNTRYCVHDESGGNGTQHHIYRNCQMKYRNDADFPHYSQCIGGGMGEHTFIEIHGGIYDTAITNPSGSQSQTELDIPISYHNGNNSKCDGKIFIDGVYLKNKGHFRFGYYGESKIKTPIEISNCSVGQPTLLTQETSGYPENFELIEFNVILRNQSRL